jgi:hypothetical protein
MFSRNTTRDAEQAQDSADFGAPPSTTHPRDLQDESGHVTFNRHASAGGSNHLDSNFDKTMAEVVGGLYDNELQQGRDEQHGGGGGGGEQKDGEQDDSEEESVLLEDAGGLPPDMDEGGMEEDLSLSSLEGDVDANQQGGRGGRGGGHGRGRGGRGGRGRGIFLDLKFICTFIQSKAGDAGVDTSDKAQTTFGSCSMQPPKSL